MGTPSTGAAPVAVAGPGFDSKELRRALGDFVTGVTVVTTVDDDGGFHGLTANSFSSVSLDPPLVLWSQAVRAPSHRVFSGVQRFAINILAEDQIALSNRFATSGHDKFAGLEVDLGAGGVPLLRGCRAWLECTVASRLPGGDHTIHVGEVRSIRRADRRPLVFGGGQYLVADPHDLGSAPSGVGTTAQAQLHAVRLGTRAMARLSKEYDETMTLAVWGNHGPTVVAWEASSAPVSASLPLGLVLSVTTSATGRALAAHLPQAATERFVAAELALAATRAGTGADLNSPDTLQAWQRELDDVRRDGLARRTPAAFHGEQLIIHALSAPVLDANGQAVLALTAVGDASRFDASLQSPFAQALAATARDISRRLGHAAAETAPAPTSTPTPIRDTAVAAH
ncbi:MAG TPA: flavin reductase [Pseudorhodoferax sp.]|nr:flavin reductase [Pseudorhodoferax sp.]